MQHGIGMPPDRQRKVSLGQLATLKALKLREEEVVFKILFNADSGGNKGA